MVKGSELVDNGLPAGSDRRVVEFEEFKRKWEAAKENSDLPKCDQRGCVVYNRPITGTEKNRIPGLAAVDGCEHRVGTKIGNTNRVGAPYFCEDPALQEEVGFGCDAATKLTGLEGATGIGEPASNYGGPGRRKK